MKGVHPQPHNEKLLLFPVFSRPELVSDEETTLGTPGLFRPHGIIKQTGLADDM